MCNDAEDQSTGDVSKRRKYWYLDDFDKLAQKVEEVDMKANLLQDESDFKLEVELIVVGDDI